MDLTDGKNKNRDQKETPEPDGPSCLDGGSTGDKRRFLLDTLPSASGTLLAAYMANAMTQGMTPDQQNILGNFVSAVGSLISYKASKEPNE